MASSSKKSTTQSSPTPPINSPRVPSEPKIQADQQADDVETDQNADSPQYMDTADPHIVPAETAARREREGNSYKQIPGNHEHSNNVDPAGGYSVDQEGLINNYATEPEMYFEVPGDARDPNQITIKPDTYTIVDVFPSAAESERIVAEMKQEGLNTDRISIIGKDYQDTKHVNGSLNWPEINQAGGLSSVLKGLGISVDEALDYETKIESNQFLVVMIGSEQDISHANQILHVIGHRTREEI
jgi:hypothetical protein